MQSRTVPVEIELDDVVIADLFDKEFEGWCPVCKDESINAGEIVCCGCFKEAMAYHTNTCGCQP